jgi:lipoic acid synthetase
MALGEIKQNPGAVESAQGDQPSAPKEAQAKEVSRLPSWLRRSVLNTQENRHVRKILKDNELNTICESGRCPNKGECWARGTATYLLMGPLCTRTCKFCSVNKGLPGPLDPQEPSRVAQASKELGLRHVVLTSVNRDDLPDQGATHFAKTIKALKEAIPGVNVEVLTPDFQGRKDCIAIVLAAGPQVYNHNVETVPRLYRKVRPGSKYDRSLKVLAMSKELAPLVPTKSGLMLGLGEREEEIKAVLADLRAVDVDFLTLGQYLQPTREQLKVDRYVTPEEFAAWADYASSLGFKMVHSGPLVRSSYHAEEIARSSHLGVPV